MTPPPSTDAPLGVMVCGHGTRDHSGVAQFASFAATVRASFPEWPTEHGYLEFASPVIRDGLESLRAQGVRRVLAVPCMLFAAGHAKNDIPSVLNLWASEHPEMRVDYGRELGPTAEMLRAAAARIRETLEAEAHAGRGAEIEETLLVVVGRGASDPDANANVAKVTRLLQESFGFGWALPAYSGVTFPLVAPALEHAVRLGYRKILVFPYFLFTGRLVERIYEQTRQVAASHPQTDFVCVPYLNDHPGVLRTFRERVLEILEGSPEMNCQLCKYRTPLPSFEAEVGLAQESHHHHVEGIGTDSAASPAPDHDHPAAASTEGTATNPAAAPPAHDHHHHPRYPHADHPLGPRNLKLKS